MAGDLDYVRLLIADTDDQNQLLSDAALQTLLDRNGGNDFRAAADALDIIATSETLVSKKIRTQDLSTDGPAVAADLRKQADRLRNRADVTDSAWDGFDILDTLPSARRPEHTNRGFDAWGL